MQVAALGYGAPAQGEEQLHGHPVKRQAGAEPQWVTGNFGEVCKSMLLLLLLVRFAISRYLL